MTDITDGRSWVFVSLLGTRGSIAPILVMKQFLPVGGQLSSMLLS